MGKKSLRVASHESLDDSLYQLSELKERWDNRLTRENLNIPKDYISGKVNLCLLIEFNGPNSPDAGQCYAIVQALENRPRTDYQVPTIGDESRIRYARSSSDAGYGNEIDVLIDIAEFGQGPQVIVPSLVWFHRRNDGDVLRRELLYLSLRSGLYEFISVPGKREIDALIASRSVNPSERNRQVIERGSGVVDMLSGEHEQVRRERIDQSKLERAMSGLGINITESGASIRFAPHGINACLNLTGLFIGPFDL